MRAQISIEYLTVMMFAIFLMTAVLVTVNVVNSRALQEELRFETQSIADQIRDEILLASEARPGYSRIFTVQQRIGPHTITISEQPQAVIVRAADAVGFARAPPFTGDITTGDNLIRRNESGVFIQ